MHCLIILNVQKFTRVYHQKKKTSLVEMIVYGHITNDINKMNPVDI